MREQTDTDITVNGQVVTPDLYDEKQRRFEDTFESEDNQKSVRKFYKAQDTPPPLLAIMFGFQQVMVCVSALLTIPFILSEQLCPGSDIGKLRVHLISSTFVGSGISTIIQTVFGFRLALLQGTAFAYVPSVMVFMKLPEYACNATSHDYVPEDVYFGKLAMIQGCLLISALIPMFIGFTGLVGVLTKFIGPITVSPLMILLVISSVDMVVKRVSMHWVAVVQAITLFATILYLAEVKVPLPGLKNGKLHWYRTPIFGQYPYIIAILTSWLFCVLLTVTGWAEEGSAARVDKPETSRVLQEAPWFDVPYPGKYGPPTLHAGLLVAFILSAMTSVFESVGDYHAAARVSNERPPPSHAINRGILAEGMGSFVSGLIGPGVGMTTHTENIGVIGVTRVASRTTMVLAGVLLILLGLFTKVGAILSTIPEPLVGGVLASSMAMVTGVAIANLQQVDLSLARNMAVIGFSIMVGMVIPEYFTKFPADTGFELLDQILKVLLTLPMFVGALTACILDNTVGGATREQRGLSTRGAIYQGDFSTDVYSYPPLVMKILNKIPGIHYLPCMPKEKKNKVAPAENGIAGSF